MLLFTIGKFSRRYQIIYRIWSSITDNFERIAFIDQNNSGTETTKVGNKLVRENIRQNLKYVHNCNQRFIELTIMNLQIYKNYLLDSDDDNIFTNSNLYLQISFKSYDETT